MPPLPALPCRRWLHRATVLLCLGALSARAWGPHPTITQAALDRLGPDHALRQMLGDHFQRLTNYCWLADFKRLPFRDVDQDFYADDYLLFPGTPLHLDHICPEVKKAYRPYFARALQALRTENAANAARWVGALLHFTEDTGSPPHAAEIRGPTHSKMENWVDPDKIRLHDYKPVLLGTNEDQAIEGFVRRMEGLIEFSKGRGRQLMTPVLLGEKERVKPVALECALETSRVVADLLHTLAFIASPRAGDTGMVLRGRIRVGNSPPRFERVPTKVILPGTAFSTLAASDGSFAFRNLPARPQVLTLLRAGFAETNVPVGNTVADADRLEINLAGQPVNLIRNGALAIRWIDSNLPDCWYRTSHGWEGELIPLESGQEYRLRVKFKAGIPGDVLVRWSKEVQYDLPQNVQLPRIESRPITAQNPELTFKGSDAMRLLQVTIRCGAPPQELCEQVELTVVP